MNGIVAMLVTVGRHDVWASWDHHNGTLLYSTVHTIPSRCRARECTNVFVLLAFTFGDKCEPEEVLYRALALTQKREKENNQMLQ